MSTASATTPASGFSEAAFDSFLKGRDEPEWLRKRRRQAFELSRSLPWPTLRDEEWRRTDIRAFKLDQFAPPSGQATEDDKAAIAPVYEELSGHYATGIEQVNAAVTRTADAAKLGGAVFLDLA